MSGEDVLPVVVVGAGPTGITAAALLARDDVPVLVLDRWEGVFTQPRAVHLDDEVYRILARVGVAPAFAAVTRPSEGLRLLDRHHRVLAEFGRGGVSEANGFPRANMFDQPVLEGVLRDHVTALPGVTLRGGVEVLDVVEHRPGEVTVCFRDRATGAEESVRARFVLGCDGANSVVRPCLGAQMEDLRFEQRWLVIDVETTADLRQWEGVHQVCDTRRAATYMRVGNARYRWEFQLHDDETAGDYGTLVAALPLMAPWLPGVDPAELELVRVAEYTFRAQIADRWRRGGIFLLGDAAHLTPPFIGQGMGAGLRDASALAWRLAGVHHGRLPYDVLDSYDTERRPHARTIIEMAKLTGVVMTRGGRWGDLVRRGVAPQLARVPGLRRRVVDSESPALTRSAWVHRSPIDRLAGRLCPNAVVGDGVRLDDVAAGRFVVVSAAPLAPSDRRALEARGCHVVEAAPGSPLATWLTSGRAGAALVRPDATVVLSGRPGAVVGEACRLL